MTPAKPRKTTSPLGSLAVLIKGHDLPGLSCAPGPEGEHLAVHVALRTTDKHRGTIPVPGKPWLATEPVPGNAPEARWECTVAVRRDDDGLDFAGPYIRGDRTDRHLGLIWGDLAADGALYLFRAAKLRLVDVDTDVLGEAMRPGNRLVVRLGLTDAKGNPVCARIRPPNIVWSAEPAND